MWLEIFFFFNFLAIEANLGVIMNFDLSDRKVTNEDNVTHMSRIFD